jgi:hypothetical protein
MIHIHTTDMPSVATETAFPSLAGNIEVQEVTI